MSTWREYWKNQHKVSPNDLQVSVARTRNKTVIKDADWNVTLKTLNNLIPSKSTGKSLDLCGGNGLFLPLLTAKSLEVTIVDVNRDLLDQVDRETYSNVILVQDDALEFLKNCSDRFDIIFCYAGIQYFDDHEVVELLCLMFERLNYDGVLLIGDIPDLNRRMDFLQKSGKIDQYFESLTSGLPIIGNWFAQDWIQLLARWSGFSDVRVIKQNRKLIYSDFRYDLIARKNS